MRIDHEDKAALNGRRAAPWVLRPLASLIGIIAGSGGRPLTTRQIAICDLEPRLLQDIGMEPDRVRRLCHLQESAAWRR